MKAIKHNKLARAYLTGAPDLRLAAAKRAEAILSQDQYRLEDARSHQETEYTHNLEAWSSRKISSPLRPQPIQQDVRYGRFYQIAAVVLGVAEVALFWSMAVSFGVNPFFSLILATVFTWGLRATLLASWYDPSRPTETKRRLQKFVLLPSLLLLLLTGATLSLARLVPGAIALLLLDWINGALFLLSMSCLGLASGLFAIADLLLWSLRATKNYEATMSELAETIHERSVVMEIIRDIGGGVQRYLPPAQ
ncbi:MAG: hypothetical protein JST84_04525 [Acidobacteria bacterium]|nr:hypothetical protein [Acidobacteriota bacterium]